MLQYTFRLSETFFQISTPKAEKKWGWNATSSHSHGQFLPVDTAPMPCIVLDLHEVPGGLSSLGVFAFGRLGCYLKFPWKFDHWNYPIVIEYIFPFSNLVFFFAYAEDIRLFLRPKCKDGVVRCGQSYWQLEAEGFGRCLRYASRAKKHNCLDFKMILVSFAVQLSVSQNQSLTLSSTLWFRSCFAS